jgi:HPt (histidine-containing phosphotransfer) domain-containing protein
MIGKMRRANMAAQEIKIPGIDAEAALELLDDDMEIYLAVLNSFVVNTPGALDNLRNVTKEKISDYAISVHGVKGICAGIGAMEASEKCKKLELMAKAGDLEGILARNDEVIKIVEKLIDDIKKWLKGK